MRRAIGTFPVLLLLFLPACAGGGGDAAGEADAGPQLGPDSATDTGVDTGVDAGEVAPELPPTPTEPPLSGATTVVCPPVAATVPPVAWT